jgi:hypothetical protein
MLSLGFVHKPTNLQERRKGCGICDSLLLKLRTVRLLIKRSRIFTIPSIGTWPPHTQHGTRSKVQPDRANHNEVNALCAVTQCPPLIARSNLENHQRISMAGYTSQYLHLGVIICLCCDIEKVYKHVALYLTSVAPCTKETLLKASWRD